MNSISFTTEITESVRLDMYAANIQGITRSRLKSGLKKLTVDGKDAKLSLKLKGGENIVLEWEDPIPEEIEAQDIPLEFLYEDDIISVINKAQGMVTHPGAGNMKNTLVNALLYHWNKKSLVTTYSDSDTPNAQRSGIVHRLDKDTSGVLITAKNREAEVFLQEQFKNRLVKKEYIAIVQGHPPQKTGAIKTQIQRSVRNRKLFTVSTDPTRGKFAHTMYRCIGIYGQYSLLRIKIKTGRTHQIRVHLKHIGCPVLGDSLYGKKDSLFADARLMLHARRLGIRLPPESRPHSTVFGKMGSPISHSKSSKDFILFTAPVPYRFKKILKTLHNTFKRTQFSDV